jgi:cytoskeletal protein CcmA (bactofilin family)
MRATETNGQYSKIDQNTSFKGSLKAKTDIRIDGTVEGDIETSGKVILGKEAQVTGEVSCANAEIEGHFKGKLTVSGILSLKTNSNVEGEVATQKLIVEAGAIFNAHCQMKTAEEGVKKLKETHEKTA